jgi:hypothetical protein
MPLWVYVYLVLQWAGRIPARWETVWVPTGETGKATGRPRWGREGRPLSGDEMTALNLDMQANCNIWSDT